jgi:hypothetical protein
MADEGRESVLDVRTNAAIVWTTENFIFLNNYFVMKKALYL